MLSEESIIRKLNQAGYRITRPRQAVIQALLEDEAHASPATVHARAKRHCPTVGLVTVYRTLDLLAEMGFVRRGNIRKSDGSVGLTKWINNDYLKSIAFINQLTYITDHHNVLQTREGEMELEFTLKSSDSFSAELEDHYEYLPVDAAIRNISIPAGVYKTSAKRLVFSTYRSRPVVVQGSYKWGRQFDGKSRSASLTGDPMQGEARQMAEAPREVEEVLGAGAVD